MNRARAVTIVVIGILTAVQPIDAQPRPAIIYEEPFDRMVIYPLGWSDDGILAYILTLGNNRSRLIGFTIHEIESGRILEAEVGELELVNQASWDPVLSKADESQRVSRTFGMNPFMRNLMSSHGVELTWPRYVAVTPRAGVSNTTELPVNGKMIRYRVMGIIANEKGNHSALVLVSDDDSRRFRLGAGRSIDQSTMDRQHAQVPR